MRSATLMFITIMIIAITTSYFCLGYIAHNKKADNVSIDDGTYSTCVVTSASIEKGKAVMVTYNGKKYALCCIAFKSVFEKDPQKYIQEYGHTKPGFNAQMYPRLIYKEK